MSGVRVIFRVKLATFYTHCIRAQTGAPCTDPRRPLRVPDAARISTPQATASTDTIERDQRRRPSATLSLLCSAKVTGKRVAVESDFTFDEARGWKLIR